MRLRRKPGRAREAQWDGLGDLRQPVRQLRNALEIREGLIGLGDATDW